MYRFFEILADLRENICFIFVSAKSFAKILILLLFSRKHVSGTTKCARQLKNIVFGKYLSFYSQKKQKELGDFLENLRENRDWCWMIFAKLRQNVRHFAKFRIFAKIETGIFVRERLLGYISDNGMCTHAPQKLCNFLPPKKEDCD